MKKLLAVALCLIVGAISPGGAESEGQPPVSYQLEIQPNDGRGGIEVTGTFRKPNGRNTEFGVLVNYGSGKNFKLIDGLKFKDEQGRPFRVSGPRNGVWKVRNPSRGAIHFSYRLRTDAEAHGLTITMPGGGEMPHLDAKSFFTFGSVSFVRPKSLHVAPVQLHWKLPEGWAIATPWTTNDSVTSVPSLADLADNYIAAGNVQTASRNLGDFSFEIAWLGNEPIEDAAVEQLAKVFSAANKVFGSPTTSNYLLIFKAITHEGSWEASPKADSIQFSVPKGSTLAQAIQFRHKTAVPPLLAALTHEYTHTWGRSRGKADDLEGTAEPEKGGDLRWMGEGFTDYIARLILLHSGIASLEDFAHEMQEFYQDLKGYPGYGKVSLLEASQGFFDSMEKRRISYAGGCLLAFQMDLALRAKQDASGKSLIGFMRQYLASTQDRSDEGRLNRFLRSWKEYAGEALARELEETTRRPVQFEFYNLIQSAGAVVVDSKTKSTYDGSVEEEAGMLKAGYVGPLAEAQGLQRGDIVLFVNGKPAKTRKEFYKSLSTSPTPVEVRREGRTVRLHLHLIPVTENKLEVRTGSLLSRFVELN